MTLSVAAAVDNHATDVAASTKLHTWLWQDLLELVAVVHLELESFIGKIAGGREHDILVCVARLGGRPFDSSGTGTTLAPLKRR